MLFLQILFWEDYGGVIINYKLIITRNPIKSFANEILIYTFFVSPFEDFRIIYSDNGYDLN